MMTWRRGAPIARRTAVCARRATARARSRFATFALAISSTNPHTANRIRRLLPYCSFMTPAPAGTTTRPPDGGVLIFGGLTGDDTQLR
jgi:hypothetical protein